MPDTTDDPLLAALATIRQRGPIGEASLVDAVRRADAFVVLVPPTARRLADLGSGGGLPGLVIAARRPALDVLLIERRATRADLLRRAVRSLQLDDHCQVTTDDARVVAQRSPGSFDVVTARSFAAPSITAEIGSTLLTAGGLLLVAEPPEDDEMRWPVSLLTRTQLADLGRREGVRVLQRFT